MVEMARDHHFRQRSVTVSVTGKQIKSRFVAK